jgi:hypothetical protein
MSKDQWLAEYEGIGNDYADGRINRAEAERLMKGLGFDRAEIAEHLDATEREMA